MERRNVGLTLDKTMICSEYSQSLPDILFRDTLEAVYMVNSMKQHVGTMLKLLQRFVLVCVTIG